MKEPDKIPLDPSTPVTKYVQKIPMPPVIKPEWNVYGQDNDDVYTPLDFEKINKVLDESSDENTKNCN